MSANEVIAVWHWMAEWADNNGYKERAKEFDSEADKVRDEAEKN